MNIVFALSFVYMTVHLTMFVFRQGVKFQKRWENDIRPTLKDTEIGKTLIRFQILRIHFLSLFSKTYKLMKIEITKSVDEGFSPEFINALANNRDTSKIEKEIHHIYSIIEKREYDKFPFEDNFIGSRNIQFIEKRLALRNRKTHAILKTLFQQFTIGRMDNTVSDEWIPLFIKNGFIDDERKLQRLDFVGDILNGPSNESTVNRNNDDSEDVEISVREVTKKRANRFDSKKQKKSK